MNFWEPQNLVRFSMPLMLGVMGWDDILMLLAKAAISAGASKAAAGNSSSTQVGDAPPLQPMDMSQLLAKPQQQQLDQPKLKPLY